MADHVWEYTILRVPTGNLGKLKQLVQDLGSVGWEVTGFASADKTIGLNEYSVMMKRPRLAPFPPPGDGSPGWKPDPSGKFELRWWTGIHWDEDVHKEGKPAKDYPTSRPGT